MWRLGQRQDGSGAHSSHRVIVVVVQDLLFRAAPSAFSWEGNAGRAVFCVHSVVSLCVSEVGVGVVIGPW